jgi:hypothetical protein
MESSRLKKHLVSDVTMMVRPHLRLSFEDLRLGPQSRQKTRPENDLDPWISDVMIRMRPHLRLSFEDLRRGFQSG